MYQKLISSLIVLLLLMNIFFEMSVSHHTGAFDKTVDISQTTLKTQYAASEAPTSEAADSCATGTCHSGYCKLINLSPPNCIFKAFNRVGYNQEEITIPKSPFLFGNRRPPKTA